jgi:NAD+ diphosphatase
MFQEIYPHILNIQHKNRQPLPNDYLLIYKDDKVLIYEEGEAVFPTISKAVQLYNIDTGNLIYLLDIDDTSFFLLQDNLSETEKLTYQDIRTFRTRQPSWICFGGATAMHLARWYENNRFCGKCTHSMNHKTDERALYCPECGLVIYPRINPVVMVAVVDNDRLLLTKYANSNYKGYSLVAGFMEIGETLEDTVKREVMEEVGLKVKNIRYFKSQPWAFSESVLVGFFVDVDGNPEPVVDGIELSEATWFPRSELPADGSNFSLTWEMIDWFRQGKVKMGINRKTL